MSPPLKVDIEYMQTLRAIRDIDQDGVTEDTFHDVSLMGCYWEQETVGARGYWVIPLQNYAGLSLCTLIT